MYLVGFIWKSRLNAAKVGSDVASSAILYFKTINMKKFLISLFVLLLFFQNSQSDLAFDYSYLINNVLNKESTDQSEFFSVDGKLFSIYRKKFLDWSERQKFEEV